MRTFAVLTLAAGLSMGCAPLSAAYGPPRARGWHQPVAQGPNLNIAAVTGRWDNVMMLPRGARIHVLKMDGGQAEGDVVSASVETLTLAVAAGQAAIAARDVARVDRLGASQTRRTVASGALHGAGAVGLLGLIAGRVPPARLFAAGAIAGAEAGVHAAPAGPQTIYLAPSITGR